MSIAEFSETIQSDIFKKWLKTLDKNIVNATVQDIRAKEQVAAKTDFILSTKTLKEMYKTVTSKTLTDSIARRVLRDISAAGKLDVPAKVVRVSGSGALFFESIGFDTITKYVTSVFDNLEGVQEAYQLAQDKYLKDRMDKISKDTKLNTGAKKQAAIDLAEKQAQQIGFGFFVHKGHVVSLATNSAKNVRESIQQANQFTQQQKELLLSVIDKYIAKLEQDDLASANLPTAHKQALYAKYIKSPSKYLVELQLKSDNLESGSASLPITNELRKVFNSSGKDLEALLSSSPSLGRKLLTTKGSPSFVELLATGLSELMVSGKMGKNEYSMPSTLIDTKVRKITKKSNKAEINKLKAVKSKIKALKPIQVKTPPSETLNLTNLQNLLNARLHDQIRANMGTGQSRSTLNYRQGRLAQSAQVERLSESRQGMITAFYTYMKYPYATFSEGGRQQYPRSRDPKLLISKSIREIAGAQVANRLRAVNV